uniref:Pectinesterase catalytic domain-containing protein n=1 Tax=Solanum lycopersicum TaxID=4081 RepID=A0A3Q7IXC1_SOLLC
MYVTMTFVFQNCLIEHALQWRSNITQSQRIKEILTPEKATLDLVKSDNVTTHLGRLRGIFSRIVMMESYIGNLIDPRGW